jgi:hypothetical protein
MLSLSTTVYRSRSVLSITRQRLNQDVAHLSYSRTQRQRPQRLVPSAMALPVHDAFAAHIITLGPPTVSNRHGNGLKRFDLIRPLPPRARPNSACCRGVCEAAAALYLPP